MPDWLDSAPALPPAARAAAELRRDDDLEVNPP